MDARTTPSRRAGCLRAFTLVELLVVVSVVALLISILLPSLRRARDVAKFVACGSNLRQIGTAIQLYASENGGLIPRGPAPGAPPDFEADDLATNQLWIGTGDPGPPSQHPREANGLGRLIDRTAIEPRLYYCPADDNFNLAEELPKIGTDASAYGSYMYRQLDRLPDAAGEGRLDRLGFNVVDDIRVRVEALAFDTNSLGPEAWGYRHTNHRASAANILFRDNSVSRHRNSDDALAIPESAFANPMEIPSAIDQLLTNADFAFLGTPADAPRLTTSPGS